MSDSIFEADELAADAVVSNDEPIVEQQEPAVQRDEHGRFAPKADEPVTDAEPQTDDDRTKHVPHAALHAEREKRREVEGKWKAAQETLDAIQRMRAEAASRKPVEATPPPVSEDPAAETEHLRQRLAQLDGTVHNMQQRDEIARVDQIENQHIAGLMSQSEAEFRTVQPDYDDAVNHVIQARAQELGFYGLNPAEVQQTIIAEVADIARAAVRQGISPAEMAYKIAQSRGYRPQQGRQQPAQQQSGSARTVAAVAAARAQSRSLGQAPGTGGTKEINLQTITAMSPDEFDALYSTPEGRRLIDAL